MLSFLFLLILQNKKINLHHIILLISLLILFISSKSNNNRSITAHVICHTDYFIVFTVCLFVVLPLSIERTMIIFVYPTLFYSTILCMHVCVCMICILDSNFLPVFLLLFLFHSINLHIIIIQPYHVQLYHYYYYYEYYF